MDNVIAFLEQHAARRPGRIALQYPLGGWGSGGLHQRSLTFGELDRESAAMAGALDRLGLQPGGRVLLLVPFSIELYVVLLALLRLGATAVVIDPSLGLRNLLDLAPRLGLAALICQGATCWLRFLPGLRQVPIQASVSGGGGAGLASLEQRMAAGSPRLPTCPVQADAPALITFTSGSTGRPRGVVRSHRFLRTQQQVLGAHLGIGPDDTDLGSLPIFLLNSLAMGATCVLPRLDSRGGVHPALLARQIEAAQATTLSGPPGFFEPLARHCLAHGLRLPAVRALFTGGAPVPPRLLEALHVVLPHAETHVIYGSTEAEPIAGIGGREAAWLSAGGLAQGRGVCVGRPVPGSIEVLLLHPRRGPIGDGERPVASLAVPPGQIGEVVVRGPHVNPGYLDDPEEERRHKIREGGTVWHRTGDLAWQDAAGRLWLTGRLADRVEQGGGAGPIDSLQAEGPVDALPFVRRSALLQLGPGGPVVMAVQPRHPGLLELVLRARRWEEEVRDRLELHGLHVDRVVFLRRLPLDRRHRSRIDRRRLRSELARRL